jgi:hypothetical protein
MANNERTWSVCGILRYRIAERLQLCTEKQQEFFRRLYPVLPRSAKRLENALDQIERTIAKNAKAGDRIAAAIHDRGE